MAEELMSKDGRLEQLAARLDCFTEFDLTVLGDVKPETPGQWRSKGTGPAYVRVGNNFLYPRSAVAAWLKARLNERSQPDAKGML